MKFTFDVECYPNYFSCCCKDLDTGEVYMFEKFEDKEIGVDQDVLLDLMEASTFIGFNIMRYDNFMVSGYLSQLTNDELFQLSQACVADKHPLLPWRGWDNFRNKFGLIRYEAKTEIDLFNIPKGFHSLKMYAARIGFRKLQELPIPWWKSLTMDDVNILRPYNENDCDATAAIFHDQRPQIVLRQALTKQYGIDMYSKSDAQIAESVIKLELKRAGITPVRGEDVEIQDEYHYTSPSYLWFKDPVLEAMHVDITDGMSFKIGNDGKMKPPNVMLKPFEFYGTTYKMGVGGLHSQESKRSITVGDDEVLCDVDVASFYPMMILNNKYAPPQYDAETFLDVYGGIVRTRLAAKASGDKTVADSLKIVINSSFGKFGNKFSSLFAPSLLIHTTITGQLLLLKLIEMMEMSGVSVVSANTDGIVCRFNKNDETAFDYIIGEWEKLTDLVLERTDYKGIYNRSVNDYFAVKPDGTYKGKATFADMGIGIVDVAPNAHILGQAVMEHVAGGRHYADVINECDDIREFVFLRKVAGGCEYDMQDVGGSVRWYIGKEFRLPMTYIKSGNNVPNTMNGVLALDLPYQFPEDLWRGWYIREAKNILDSIGWTE